MVTPTDLLRRDSALRTVLGLLLDVVRSSFVLPTLFLYCLAVSSLCLCLSLRCICGGLSSICGSLSARQACMHLCVTSRACATAAIRTDDKHVFVRTEPTTPLAFRHTATLVPSIVAIQGFNVESIVPANCYSAPSASLSSGKGDSL